MKYDFFLKNIHDFFFFLFLLFFTGTQIRRIQQTKTMPPLVAAQSSANQSYVIPISLGGKSIATANRTFQPVVVQTTPKSLLSPTAIKATAVPVLSSALPRSTAMLQTQQPQIVTVSGKTMIRAVASSASAGVTTSMQFIQAKAAQAQPQPQQQQKIIVAGANMLGNAGNKVRNALRLSISWR